MSQSFAAIINGSVIYPNRDQGNEFKVIERGREAGKADAQMADERPRRLKNHGPEFSFI